LGFTVALRIPQSIGVFVVSLDEALGKFGHGNPELPGSIDHLVVDVGEVLDEKSP